MVAVTPLEQNAVEQTATTTTTIPEREREKVGQSCRHSLSLTLLKR
jgi:hypothetical protein